jgi:hypothetical protein
VGDELAARARVAANYKRKGHQLVDPDIIRIANGHTMRAYCKRPSIACVNWVDALTGRGQAAVEANFEDCRAHRDRLIRLWPHEKMQLLSRECLCFMPTASAEAGSKG